MSLAALNAQIAASRERLRELYRKRKAILGRQRAISKERRVDRRRRNLEILRLFDDAGLTSRQISRKLNLSDTMVRQFLRDRGRTKRGREASRSLLAAMVETMK